jgi:predicted NBD/HSP70 family sugar kinase
VSDRFPVGADVGGTKLLLAAGDARQRVPTGPDTEPRALEAAIRRFLADHRLSPTALGVAIPGLLDAGGAVVACDVLPGLVGWRPAEALADLGCPVLALNDAEAALVEEAHDLSPGATAGIVMAGTAIGAAFRVEGVPLRGAAGWAGELGYLPLRVGEGVARLDELAGGAFLVARLGCSGAELRRRAEAGDGEARAAVREGGFALGLALAAVINLLNPHLLVLGGGALSLPGYEEAALEAAKRHSLPESLSACTLRGARAGDAVAALGAARAAAEMGGR